MIYGKLLNININPFNTNRPLGFGRDFCFILSGFSLDFSQA